MSRCGRGRQFPSGVALRLASVSTPDLGIGAELKDTVEGIVGYRTTLGGKGEGRIGDLDERKPFVGPEPSRYKQIKHLDRI